MAVYFDAPNGQPFWQVQTHQQHQPHQPRQQQPQQQQQAPVQDFGRQAWYPSWDAQDDYEYGDGYSYGEFMPLGAEGAVGGGVSWSTWGAKSAGLSTGPPWGAPSFVQIPEEPDDIAVVNSSSSGAYASLCKDAETADLVAFDAEWVPDWTSYSDNPISVLQLAFPDSRRVYVLQLERLSRKLPQAVQMMLVNPGVKKVGFAVSVKDAEKLTRSGIAVTKDSMVDIQTRCTAAMGLPWSSSRSLSLKRAAHQLLGWAINKECATSDWSSEKLSPKQVRYAALDAWVALRLYYHTC